MSTFAVLLLFIQACILQNAFGQYFGGCGCGYAGPAIDIAPAVSIGSACGSTLGPFVGPVGGAIAPAPAYSGTGEGNVVVAGELPVAGNTAVAGQVPIMGAVSFGGAMPAAGAVSISGQCACGCGSHIHY